MFRDARVLDRQHTAASFAQGLAHYGEHAEDWFDGSVNSVDARLAQCHKHLHTARATVARYAIADSPRYLHAIEALAADAAVLGSLREDLLTGASSREDVSGPPGWKTAALDGPDARWVTLESARFVAAHSDALDDPHELATRAAHHAAVKTSTFTPEHSRVLCGAFVAAVTELGAAVYRPPVRTAAAVYDDFEAEAIYLC